MKDQFLLDPGIVFLNHGSFGACPKTVFDRYQAWQRELEHQPVLFLGRRHDDLLAVARNGLAGFTGTSADNLFFVANATSGLNTFIKSLNLRPGDEILSTDLEYGALDRTWIFLARKHGWNYVRQPVRLPIESGESFVENIWSGVTSRTKILFLSHITSSTAITFPIKPLIDRAKEAGIVSVVDGAHVPGQLDLNLDTLGADVYSGNCHKWLMSPKGAAFLYVHPAHQHRVEPLVISWGDQDDQYRNFIAENQFQGTRDISPWLSVPAAIEFFHAHAAAKREGCRELVRHARREMEAITGLPAIIPAGPEWHQQMYAQPLPDIDGEALKKRLYDVHRIEIPVMPQNGRWYVRISIQCYNTAEDVDFFLEALRIEI